MQEGKKRVIVFSLAYYPKESGAEIAVREIIARSPDYHFDVITYRFDSSWAKREELGNATIYRVGGPGKYGYILQAAVKAARLHNHNQYDFAWALMAAYAAGSGLIFRLWFPKTPLLLTLQEGDPVRHILKRVGILRPLYGFFFKHCVTRVQAISNYLGVFARDMGYAGEIDYVPNGVEFERMKVRRHEDAGVDITTTVLITDGRLVEKNGIDTLIKSMKFVPKGVILRILGDGEDRDKLHDLSRHEGLANRIQFLGAVAHERVNDFHTKADIFVRASRSEGLGSSFLEAMAAGLPIIGTNVGGIPDFLKDGETGLFCQADNPESIAVAVKKLTTDNALYEKLAKNGRELVEREYTWAIVAKKMSETFSKVLSPK